MSAHTPGPWIAERGRESAQWFVNDSDCNFAISTGFGETAEANARLISAAPDMLAILKDMRNAPDPYDGVGGWWEEIDDAIAKATGST